MKRPTLRPGRSPDLTPALLLADIAVVLLCLTAMFWLLVSPLIPIMFDERGLLLGTFGLGLPLGAVGVVLNHLAAQSERRKAR